MLGAGVLKEVEGCSKGWVGLDPPPVAFCCVLAWLFPAHSSPALSVASWSTHWLVFFFIVVDSANVATFFKNKRDFGCIFCFLISCGFCHNILPMRRSSSVVRGVLVVNANNSCYAALPVWGFGLFLGFTVFCGLTVNIINFQNLLFLWVTHLSSDKMSVSCSFTCSLSQWCPQRDSPHRRCSWVPL